ncbi:MAG: hypothetical protein PHW60_08270 [Kiritimatiellae bacterium]|nr:hypothetical protein [Kiritimatiellia bacterium]
MKTNRHTIQFLIFLAFAVLLNGRYAWEGARQGASMLVTDQVNFLTICARNDYPDRLDGDMIAGEAQSAHYYIPAFVDLVRLCSQPDHDYLRGLSLLLFLTGMLYMAGWYLVFRMRADGFTAAVLAFFVRAVCPLPGWELWGIAGRWTMLARTLVLALVPWILWLWLKRRPQRRYWFGACLFSGLAIAFHPLSGLSLAAAMLLAETFFYFWQSRRIGSTLRRLFLGVLGVACGLLPLLIVCGLPPVGAYAGIDLDRFNEALRQRFPPELLQPALALRLWLDPRLLAVLILPWMAYAAIPRAEKLSLHEIHGLMVLFLVGCLGVALLPVGLGLVLPGSSKSVQYTFEMIRSLKHMVIPGVVVGALVCGWVAAKLTARRRYGRVLWGSVLIAAVLLTLAGRHPAFDRVPVLGSSTVRCLWPGLWETHAIEKRHDQKLDGVMAWIGKHTSERARFVGPGLIRVAALRSVVHDHKGGSMLIRENPAGFVDWGRRETRAREIGSENAMKLPALYRSWGADYWVTDRGVAGLKPCYQDDHWFIYDVAPRQ